jgi:hypothetical protein
MTAPVKPALARSFGTESYAWVPAIADPAAPTVAELTAATALPLQGFLTGDQGGVSGSTDKVTLPRRLMETETYEVNGATSYSAADFTLFYDPQAAAGSDEKKAWESLEDGAEGFLVWRGHVDPTTDFVAGQFVSVYPAQLGTKVETKTASDASGAYAFTLGVSVTGQPSKNVAVVA